MIENQIPRYTCEHEHGTKSEEPRSSKRVNKNLCARCSHHHHINQGAPFKIHSRVQDVSNKKGYPQAPKGTSSCEKSQCSHAFEYSGKRQGRSRRVTCTRCNHNHRPSKDAEQAKRTEEFLEEQRQRDACAHCECHAKERAEAKARKQATQPGQRSAGHAHPQCHIKDRTEQRIELGRRPIKSCSSPTQTKSCPPGSRKSKFSKRKFKKICHTAADTPPPEPVNPSRIVLGKDLTLNVCGYEHILVDENEIILEGGGGAPIKAAAPCGTDAKVAGNPACMVVVPYPTEWPWYWSRHFPIGACKIAKKEFRRKREEEAERRRKEAAKKAVTTIICG